MAPAANFKIGIQTSTVSQAEEEYRAAEGCKGKVRRYDYPPDLPGQGGQRAGDHHPSPLSPGGLPTRTLWAIIGNTAMEGTAAAMERRCARNARTSCCWPAFPASPRRISRAWLLTLCTHPDALPIRQLRLWKRC